MSAEGRGSSPSPKGVLMWLLLLTLLLNLPLWTHQSCDRLYTQSDGGGSQIGTFQSPNRSSSRSIRTQLDQDGNLSISTTNFEASNKSMSCVYRFVAGPNEKVMVKFTRFHLRGEEPECSLEYADIYLKLKSETSSTRKLPPSTFDSRFCTSLIPRRLISLHDTLMLVFYSELKPPQDGRPLFEGTFEFVKQKSYDQIDPPLDDTLCTHIISSSDRRDGEFQSLSYPGVYVKGLKCSYKFLGNRGQRVRLEFLDLDLYSGGSHCPFDSIKIYDGDKETDPIIHNLCGSYRSLILYSTREKLLVTLTTLERESEVRNRGFSACFEFSDKFVNTNFIRGPNVKHVRGSECDQRIISQKATKGIITSPNLQLFNDTICRYFFEGLQTSVDSERVQLKFVEFDFKGSKSSNQQVAFSTPSPQQIPVTLIALLSSNQSLVDNNSPAGANSTVEPCSDNYLRVYTSEQKPDQKQDPNDYDYVFCGSEKPSAIESDAATLVIEYNSGAIGGNFKAEYSFIIDYKISGTQVPPGCDYIYRSDLLKTGLFNSPRHPSYYLNDLNCSYTFFVKQDEALLIEFVRFKMSGEIAPGYNEACKNEDRIEIIELTLESSELRIIDQTELGSYCGATTPGPILSYRPMRVNFKPNREHVNYGFSAQFGFYKQTELKSNEFVTNCGGQIIANQRTRSGVISSPETYRPDTYEKRNHICSWNITARPTHRIMLSFTKFELEGSPSARGCNSCSVRLDLGPLTKPKEICGSLKVGNGTGHQFTSDGEWLSLTFISTKQASGSNGFNATWTEIKKAA